MTCRMWETRGLAQYVDSSGESKGTSELYFVHKTIEPRCGLAPHRFLLHVNTGIRATLGRGELHAMSSQGVLMKVAAALLFFVATCLVPGAHGYQAPPGSGVIHALLVADSDSNLRKSVLQDVVMLSGALEEAFKEHPSRLRLETRTGKSVKVSEILSWFHNLNSNPDDTLLFYYSGHGEIRPNLGHVLSLTNAENGNKILPRADILREMKCKRTRLVVVLTDCCSTIRPLPPPPSAVTPVPPPPPWAVAGCLLLQHRGLVDINASCPGQEAWPDFTAVGGIFTGNLSMLLNGNMRDSIDKNGDKFIEWDEFYPMLEKRTQLGFRNLQLSLERRKKARDPLTSFEQQAVDQTTQKIWTCSVLPFLRLGVRVLDSPGGLKLEEIYPGTPASTAQGLKNGDFIVGVGDKQVQNERDFLLAVDATKTVDEMKREIPIVLKVKEPGAVQPRAVSVKLRDNDVPADVRLPWAPSLAPPPPAQLPAHDWPYVGNPGPGSVR